MATPKKPAKSAKPQSTDADKQADKPAHVPPVVNLTHAAQSAAMLLAARSRRAAEAEGSGVNSAAFKKIKDAMNQPAQHAPTSPLAGLNRAVKPTGVAGYNRPGGHHQNASANVARTGVPRRTSGG